MRGAGVFLFVLCFGMAGAHAEPIAIVAAENFYGDVALQIGGDAVTVGSILSNPDQDPHLFEASASTARQLAAARIVIFNGIDYDPWMGKLLSASKNAKRETIEVARLMARKPGDNPHLWYDPETMPRVAAALAESLRRHDPEHARIFDASLAAFLSSLAPLTEKIAALKSAYAGTPVTATEPVFGYMAAALGLKMRNERFQFAIMNETEPGSSDIAAFETDLRQHRVKVLIFNSQTSGTLAARMQHISAEAGVPTVGVGETEPAGTKYQDWMLAQLTALETALSAKQP